jgi:pyruvate dehydrogenase E1 component alpha subunit
LIICENNKYAAHTPIEKRQAVAKLAERTQAFGIPFEKHDGNDPLLLLETLERVVPEIRAGKGPRCIEIATYRFCGHVGPGEDEEMGYRSAEELNLWKLRDPVLALRRQLAESVEQLQLEQLESGIDADIHSAIAAAKRADWADFTDIVDMNWSGEYASIVEFKSGDVSTFAGSQSEALPGPF